MLDLTTIINEAKGATSMVATVVALVAAVWVMDKWFCSRRDRS